MDQRRIKPWMVVVVLAAVGIAGAVLVYAGGARLHRSDRRAIVAWYLAARPSLDRMDGYIAQTSSLGAKTFTDALPSTDLQSQITRLRAGIEDAKFTLEHVRVESVMEVIAGAYLNASVDALGAISALHQWTFARNDAARARERSAFSRKIDAAASRWARAGRAAADLRARYGIS